MLVANSGGSSGEAAGAQKFSTTLAAGSGVGQVYMGQTTPPMQGTSSQARKNAEQDLRAQGDIADAQAIGLGPQDQWVSENQAENSFYGWSAKQQQDFIAKGIVGGLLKYGDGPLEAATLWKKLVKEAAAYGAQGRKITPMDLLGSYVSAAGSAQPFSRTTTQTSVNLTDPTTAKAMATSVFQQMLGRDPNPGELAAFGSALAQAEDANPSTTTTTTQYDARGQAISQESNSSGGMTDQGRQYLAEQQIKAKPEYGATQAATTYMNALESAIYGAHG